MAVSTSVLAFNIYFLTHKDLTKDLEKSGEQGSPWKDEVILHLPGSRSMAL